MKRGRNRVGVNKEAQFYKIGDKVEAIKTNIGAWFDAEIIDIHPHSKCLCSGKCSCTYKLLFEGDEGNESMADKTLDEIRQVSYASHNWEDLKPGMKVVINYNVENPGSWGYWYDCLISKVSKNNSVISMQGTLLIGHNGTKGKIPVEINSNDVADVLAIRPHVSVSIKEKDNYETGVKPVFCSRCKNKPKLKCKACCCCMCGIKQDYQLTVQCDECTKWYHTYCLKPPLTEMPDENDDWYCPKCNNENNSFETRRKPEKGFKIMKQKRKYVRRKNGINIKLPALKRLNKQILKELKLSKDINMVDITKYIPTNSEAWDQIFKLCPENLKIQHIFIAVKEKEGHVSTILPDTQISTSKRNSKNDSIISMAAEVAITNDEINKHLWDEARKYMDKGKKAFLNEVEHLFTCSICCELMQEPITLSCKHSFCIACFFKSLENNVYSCALCRTAVIHTQSFKVNENLQKALNLLFPK